MDYLTCHFFEVKASGDDDGCITGYGSVFDNVDSYGDIVAPGAFKKSISDVMTGATAWPAMLLQHGDATADGRCPIGIWTRMSEDEHGLRLEGKLALRNTRGREAYELLKMTPRPALNGLSIGFRCKEFELHKSGPARRTIKGAELVEISLVNFPANTKATVLSVKSGEPEPVIVDWKEVARADYDRLAKEMTKHNRNYN